LAIIAQAFGRLFISSAEFQFALRALKPEEVILLAGARRETYSR
jgi:hypothetical protein